VLLLFCKVLLLLFKVLLQFCKVQLLCCKVLLFCYSVMPMGFEFSPLSVDQNTQRSKFMILHSAVTELCHGAEVGRADRQTDGLKWRKYLSLFPVLHTTDRILWQSGSGSCKPLSCYQGPATNGEEHQRLSASHALQ
jgi:hypothetical protein